MRNCIVSKLRNENKLLKQEIKLLELKLALDQFTGLLNKTHMQKVIDESETTCIIMADIDHFKKINDTYGHMVGDIVLKHIADVIRSCVKKSDKVSRFGGEEFLIKLKDLDYDKARLVSERIRRKVESSIILVDGNLIKVTLSLGVGENKDDADKALYIAKGTGRNKVEVIQTNPLAKH